MDNDSDIAPAWSRYGRHTALPCLRVHGAQRLIEFIEKGLGAELVDRTVDDEGRIRYAALRVSGSVVTLSDTHDRWGPLHTAVHVYVPDVDRVHASALAAGGQELFAPADMPYGERGSGVEDPFGNHWYLATMITSPGARG
jgi:uncharacterized glyoxalase superfamily protein PhnB